MVLQEFEKQWVNDRAGRTEVDVYVDDNGDKYIHTLIRGGEKERYYLPKTKEQYDKGRKQR